MSGLAAEKRAPRAPSGKSETLACRLGTEDRHARIAVVLTGGKVTEFAYYSKWKPRTCSIYLQRNRDTYSTWADNGHLTTINVARGAFLIEHGKGQYRFVFRDIDRERYCGMDGRINGSLTIRKGSDACELEGVMEEGTLLGEANLKRDEPGTTGAAPSDSGSSTAVQPTATAASAESSSQNAASTLQNSSSGQPSSEGSQTASQPSQPDAGTKEKAAEPGSTNPFRAFFRALTQPRPPQPEGQ